MEMELEYPRKSFPIMKIVGILILFILTLYAIQYGQHASYKHGENAEKARECLEKNNILFTMTNFLNGKCAVVGKISEEDEKGRAEYGISIVKDGKEITSFSKFDLLKTVIRYLENTGYFLSE